MKVLLVYPTNANLSTEPSLGLMYLASVLRNAGHDLEIVEGDFETIKRISSKPDFVGITCMTSMYHEIIKMRDYFRKRNIPLIFGGPHATVLPESLLADGDFKDYVVVGEGEKTMLKILDGKLEAGIVQGELTQDLDLLPFPARDLIPKKYLRHHKTTILASRGCPNNCSFCQPTLRKLFGSKIRRRSIDNLMKEIDECNERFGIRHFEFFDDTFTSDRGWSLDFASGMKQRKATFEMLTRVDTVDFELLKSLKKAGLTRIALGIETGSQKILNSYCKGIKVEQSREAIKMCNKLGLKVNGYFMLGALDETHETIQETRDFIKHSNFDTIFVTVTTPMPGTRLYEQASREGRLLVEWQNMDLLGSLFRLSAPKNRGNTVAMKLKHLSNNDILDARYSILKSFYLRKIRNPLYLCNFVRQKGFDYVWKAAKHILWNQNP